MSEALASDEQAGRWLSLLESRERSAGKSAPGARATVARRLGVLPGTLENISRGRTKGVRAWIFETLRAAVIRDLEGEIQKLEHELEVARLCASRLDEDEVFAAQAAIRNARRLLKITGE